MNRQSTREGSRENTLRSETEPSRRIYTVPNALCLIRLLGSFGLIPLALLDRANLFLWGFLLLAATDWLDGKLAILLNQRSVLGARLDSWADAALYAALVVGVVILFGESLTAEAVWLGPALGSYLLSTLAGFAKFGRWPSYHTRAAKTSWLLTAIAVIALFTDWSLWPLRIAAIGVTLTNLEALAITFISATWRSDVTSIYHAWRDQHGTDNT